MTDRLAPGNGSQVTAGENGSVSSEPISSTRAPPVSVSTTHTARRSEGSRSRRT